MNAYSETISVGDMIKLLVTDLNILATTILYLVIDRTKTLRLKSVTEMRISVTNIIVTFDKLAD